MEEIIDELCPLRYQFNQDRDQASLYTTEPAKIYIQFLHLSAWQHHLLAFLCDLFQPISAKSNHKLNSSQQLDKASTQCLFALKYQQKRGIFTLIGQCFVPGFTWLVTLLERNCRGMVLSIKQKLEKFAIWLLAGCHNYHSFCNI